MLSPEFFTSGDVTQHPIEVRYTFAGLWVYLDDYGRGEDSTALIKAVVWPKDKRMSETVIERHLAALNWSGMICRYVSGCDERLHIPSWKEHQAPSHPGKNRDAPCSRHEPEAFATWLALPRQTLARPARSTLEGLRRRLVKSSSVEVGLDDAAELDCDHNPLEPKTCALCRNYFEAVIR